MPPQKNDILQGTLAMLVLKERVTRWQAAGMVLALAAVAMIAAA